MAAPGYQESSKVNMKHRKELIVFDWDGTLMDSQARIVNCLRITIADMALTERHDEQLSDVIGLGFREALFSLYPQDGDHYHTEFVARYRQYFMHEDKTPSVMFAGARELLMDLNEQDYFLAIATGKGRIGLDHALKENEIGQHIHASRCADETRSKPHPQMLEELMDFFAVEPEDTIMIGDTEYDLEMANNAKVQCLAVSHGVHDQARLEKFNPVTCVANITELDSWLSDHLIKGNG